MLIYILPQSNILLFSKINAWDSQLLNGILQLQIKNTNDALEKSKCYKSEFELISIELNNLKNEIKIKETQLVDKNSEIQDLIIDDLNNKFKINNDLLNESNIN